LTHFTKRSQVCEVSDSKHKDKDILTNNFISETEIKTIKFFKAQ